MIGAIGYNEKNYGLYIHVKDYTGSMKLALPVTHTVEDIIDPCPANNVTVTFTPVVAERTGETSVTVYNKEMLEKADAAFTYDNIKYIVENRDSISKITSGTYDINSITELAQSDTMNALASVLLVNEIGNSTVTLTEVDDSDGNYEGKQYVLESGTDQQLPVKASVNVPILGEYSVFDTTIPINVGKAYDFSNIRVGHYTLSVSVPSGDGYICSKTDYDVQITEGGKAVVGKDEEHLNISGNISVFDTFDIPLSATLFKNTGIYVDREENNVSFTKVDMGSTPLADAEFVLINRDQALAILDEAVSAGKETVDNAIQNGIGGLNFDQLSALYEDLLNSSEYAKTDSDTAYNFLASYTSLLAKGLAGKQAPAILKATSNDKGTVSFTEASNVTIPTMVELLIKAKDLTTAFGSDIGSTQLYGFTVNELGTALQDVASTECAYYLLKTAGIVGDKFPTGDYILAETAAPEGYYRNFAMYTFANKWNDKSSTYDTYAQIGVITPLAAPEMFDYFEQLAPYNEQIASVSHDMAAALDEVIMIAMEEANLNSDTTAAVIAYASELIYNKLGGNAIYESPEAVADALMEMLMEVVPADSESKETYTINLNLEKLVNAINALSLQAKTVISGDVNADWYYYNISKDTYSNGYDLFDYVLRKFVSGDIADQIEGDIKEATDALEEIVNGTARDLSDNTEQADDTMQNTIDKISE